MLNLTQLYDAGFIAIIAYTFSVLMTDQGDIFEWYYHILDKLKMKRRWYSHFANPLGWCEKCFAGQLALWYYLYKNWGAVDICGLIAFICLSVFLTVLIRKFKLK